MGEPCVFIGLAGGLPVIKYTKDADSALSGVIDEVTAINELKKPETKQQREDRERLENGKAFYELMSEIEISVMNPEANGHPNQWDELIDEWQQVYILQAEKLKYRKEVE